MCVYIASEFAPCILNEMVKQRSTSTIIFPEKKQFREPLFLLLKHATYSGMPLFFGAEYFFNRFFYVCGETLHTVYLVRGRIYEF
jgi:hypothetical protein